MSFVSSSVRSEWGTLYCPVSESADGEYILILLFHGMGTGDRAFLSDRVPWLHEAEERGYLLFSVRSDHRPWIELEGYPDEKRTRKALKSLEITYPIKENSTVLWGWSAGGGFVNSLITRNESYILKKTNIQFFCIRFR